MSPALAEVERIARTERFISFIRAAVVAFNVITYLAFAGAAGTPRYGLALIVCAGASVYTIVMLAWRPHGESKTLLAAATGTVVDTFLIGVWLYATGGFESPYFPILYAETAATVGRFGVRLGAASALVASGMYYLVASFDSTPVPAYPISVRIAYLYVIVAFVGYVVEIARRSERYTAAAEAETEALREMDRLRSIFVAHISHELRTPLTAVRGAAITLNGKATELDSDEAGVLIEMIDRQSLRLSSLIEDIIEVGLIEEGRLTPRMSAIDLGDLVRGVVQTADRRGHEIVLAEVQEPIRVVCDGPKLAGALTKVLDNAVKFSDTGEMVSVWLEDRSDHVRICVRDRGIGVAPEHKARIFESFFQVDPTMSRATPGTGIGLSIARAVMESHGGSIEVSSDGTGSTFVLRLPRNGRPSLLRASRSS